MSDRRFTSARISAVVAVACGLLFGATGASAQPLSTGITNTSETSVSSFEETKATGSSFVKIPLDWNSTVAATPAPGFNPENPADPNYDWSRWDEQVNHAASVGLTVVLQLGGAPAWAQRCAAPAGYPIATCDPDPAALAAFATAAARHFNGSVPGVPIVRYWQILNEPNLSLFFLPQYDTSGKLVSPTLYRALINASYAAIKAVNPSNLVILGGLGPIAVPKYTIGPMAFARELLCMKGRKKPKKTPGTCEGGVHFDIFAMQPYTTGGPTHEGGPDDVEIGDLPKLKELIKAADKAGRIKGAYKHTPLWITEFSWDTKPPDPGGLAMKIATRWVSEALYVSWKAGVSNFFWYSLRDAVPGPGHNYKNPYESGLYQSDGRPKPILTAFRFPFVAYPDAKSSRLSVWGRTPTSKGGKVAVQIEGKKGWTTIGRVKADKNGIFKGKFKTDYGVDKSGAVRAVVKGATSAAFSMRPVRDFYHPPFG
jgi:hypothetical protein